MSDTKASSSGRQGKKKGRKGKRKGQNYLKVMRMHTNEMVYSTRWEYGQLSSSTSGNIAKGDIAPSIVNSSESSQVAALFGKIRLLKCTVVFGAKANSLSTVSQGTLLVGTDQFGNQNNSTLPSNITFVQNLANRAEVQTSIIRNYRYRMAVDPNLEFSAIGSDAPTPPTPYAGSPGCVRVWASALTVSTAYFDVFVEAVYHLSSRQ